MNKIIDIILYGVLFSSITLMALVFYSFIFIFPIFIIKIAILINLKTKYNKELENEDFILQILKYSIIYKVLFQYLINIIFGIYSWIFKENINIIKIFISILTIISFLFLSYKSLYKKSKKIFKIKKFCIWYSILLMPGILITIVYNFIVIAIAYTIPYIT